MSPDHIMLLDEQNHEVALSSLWESNSVLLFFMRHLGCGLCRHHLLQLKKYTAQFKEANIDIAVIMIGDGALAHSFAKLYNLPFPVFGDPALQAYGAFEIREGTLWDAINPGILARQVGLLIKGMRPMWGPGSFRQLGGLVVVDPSGTLQYHHVVDPIYKYPPWEDVLAAAQESQMVGLEKY